MNYLLYAMLGSCLYTFSICTAIANEKTAYSGDPDAGKVVYTQCQGCHSPGWHRTGPKHCYLLGRRAGSAKGYKYSQAMENSAIVWDEHTLDEFLKSPFTYIEGNSMGFAGVKDNNDRHNLIAYLVQLNHNSELCNP